MHTYLHQATVNQFTVGRNAYTDISSKLNAKGCQSVTSSCCCKLKHIHTRSPRNIHIETEIKCSCLQRQSYCECECNAHRQIYLLVENKWAKTCDRNRAPSHRNWRTHTKKLNTIRCLIAHFHRKLK